VGAVEYRINVTVVNIKLYIMWIKHQHMHFLLNTILV